ncbi:hypothetical protein [Streptomyces sp. Ru73]|nr:hypothetical protein [Streptomyces sp. Ru73]
MEFSASTADAFLLALPKHFQNRSCDKESERKEKREAILLFHH